MRNCKRWGRKRAEKNEKIDSLWKRDWIGGLLNDVRGISRGFACRSVLCFLSLCFAFSAVDEMCCRQNAMQNAATAAAADRLKTASSLD
jgi:hypothetical protein